MTYMKRITSLVLLLSVAFMGYSSKPDEGMWLPLYLKNLNEADMKKLGLQMGVDQIYNIENASIKDAIVRLNNGSCTAELVSSQGLVFTNHHCAYGHIWDAIGKELIDKESYKKNGFWSQSKDAEIGGLGMSAGLLNYIENITDKIYPKLEKISNEQQRQIRKAAIADSLEALIEGDNDFIDAQVKEMFDGNQFYMYVYKVYKDVRLVASPPESIGKFGGDTDNWMWPRHTGDFAVLRIYANGDNEPAEYDEGNRPFNPKHFLPVSIADKKPGDFSMIMGFPGTTERYLTSYDLTTKLDHTLPARVETRDVVLNIMEKYMNQDDKLDTRMKSTRAQIANYWKLWSGQMQMARLYDLTSAQEKEDKALMEWIQGNNLRINRFGEVMGGLQAYNDQMREVTPYIAAYQEGLFGRALSSTITGIRFQDLAGVMVMLDTLEEGDQPSVADVEQRKADLQNYLKNRIESYFDMSTVANSNWGTANPHEQELITELLLMMYEKHPKEFHPAFLKRVYEPEGDDKQQIVAYVQELFEESFVFDKKKALKYIEKPKSRKILKDPFIQFASEMRREYITLIGKARAAQGDISKYRRLYMEALMKMKKNKTFYPDANSSMRLTYGTIKAYDPRDAVSYDYVTSHHGVLEKNNPNDPEFRNADKTLNKFKNQDFGDYGDDTLVLCFLTNHDITGGNSGSPVIDGKGNLIGIAFDGNWEAATSDFLVMPQYNRTISVDIRYVLWTIDEFGNCDRLIQEMKIVKGEPADAPATEKADAEATPAPER